MIRLSTSATEKFMAADKNYGASIPLTRLLERVSKNENHYLTGRLGAAKITEKNICFATNAAHILVAQGAKRDDIARGLRTYLNNGSVTAKQRVAITRVVNQVVQGTRGLPIENKTRSDIPMIDLRRSENPFVKYATR